MKKEQRLIEESFWIGAGERRIFVNVHRAGGDTARRGVFVFCPPFAEEKNKSQRLYVELARALSAAGFDIFRFDYEGTGDSTGNFEHARIATWKSNIHDVIRFCLKDDANSPVGLVGMRFGAALAATVAEECPSVKWLVLLAPIADVSAFFRRILRSKLVKEMMTSGAVVSSRRQIEKDAQSRTVDLDGFSVSPGMYNDISGFDAIKNVKAFKGAVLILHASKNPRVTMDEKVFRDAYAKFNRNVTLIEVKAEPFWNVNGVPPFDDIVNAVLGWTHRKCHVKRWAAGVAGVDKPGARELECSDRIAVNEGTDQVVRIDLPRGFISGIAHVPTAWGGTKHPYAIVAVHGWAGYRIGPHQMLATAANDFCRKGFLVLRIDVRGRGNSSGPVDCTDILSMREDAVYAVQYVREKLGAEKVIVLGQCRGGNAILGVDEADGFVVWSAPPIDESLVSKVRKTRFMLQSYIAKASSSDTWWKFARGELNYALILEAVLGHFKWGVTPRGTGVQELKSSGFAGKRTLMIYGENDPDTEPAERSLMEFCSRTGLVAEFYTIPGANHSFYSIVWKQEVLDITTKWLMRHFRQTKSD